LLALLLLLPLLVVCHRQAEGHACAGLKQAVLLSGPLMVCCLPASIHKHHKPAAPANSPKTGCWVAKPAAAVPTDEHYGCHGPWLLKKLFLAV
jgi:hypothetical protein